MRVVTVLLIEDNPLNLEMARFLLEEAGHTVLCAESAGQAWNLVRGTRPHVILMDLNLPGKDGYQLIEEFKGNSDLMEVPIVAFTAMAMPAEQRAALDAGCCGVICKPIDVGTFAETVVSYLAPEEEIPDEGSIVTRVMPRAEGVLFQADSHLQTLLGHDWKLSAQGLHTGIEVLKAGKLGPLTEEQNRLIDEMTLASARLQRELEDLNVLQALLEGRLTLQLSPCLPETLLREKVLPALDPLLRSRQHHLQWHCETGGNTVMVDDEQLARVLTALLENAVYSMPSGGVIELRMSAAGRDLQIELLDGAPSLDPAFVDAVLGHAPTVDKRFRQASVAFRLYLADTILAAHQGGLQYVPLENGNRYLMRLPLSSLVAV